MIDFHTHIAWDVDDGLETEEQARKALQMAREHGTEAIVSTPHITPGKDNAGTLSKIRKRQQQLRALAEEYDISIVFGSEVLMNYAFPSALKKKEFFPVENTSYVLAEFDVTLDYAKLDNARENMYELLVSDYTPILAHAERYFKNKLDMNQIDEWIEKGVIIQVNRTSLLGLAGKQNEKNARRLLEAGKVHLIASDMHRTEGRRIPVLDDVYAFVKKQASEKTAELLLQKNPEAILKNQKPVLPEPLRKKRFSFFG